MANYLKKRKTKGFTLAEGATHVNSLPAKAEGFTLAEVLITLGIIGVVAAMTIPTLIANTRSQQYRSQFKKTLSTLNQAARMAQAQYDFDFGGLDVSGEDVSTDDNPNTTKSITALINGTLTGGSWDPNSGMYSIPSEYNGAQEFYDQLHGSGAFTYHLSDGSSVSFNSYGNYHNSCTKSDPCYGVIDINGPKSKPNKVVKCKNGETTELFSSHYDASAGWISETESSWNNTTCPVDNSSMGDLFPVYFYDNSVVPATNAAAYVLNTAK